MGAPDFYLAFLIVTRMAYGGSFLFVDRPYVLLEGLKGPAKTLSFPDTLAKGLMRYGLTDGLGFWKTFKGGLLIWRCLNCLFPLFLSAWNLVITTLNVGSELKDLRRDTFMAWLKG